MEENTGLGLAANVKMKHILDDDSALRLGILLMLAITISMTFSLFVYSKFS